MRWGLDRTAFRLRVVSKRTMADRTGAVSWLPVNNWRTARHTKRQKFDDTGRLVAGGGSTETGFCQGV